MTALKLNTLERDIKEQVKANGVSLAWNCFGSFCGCSFSHEARQKIDLDVDSDYSVLNRKPLVTFSKEGQVKFVIESEQIIQMPEVLSVYAQTAIGVFVVMENVVDSPVYPNIIQGYWFRRSLQCKCQVCTPVIEKKNKELETKKQLERDRLSKKQDDIIDELNRNTRSELLVYDMDFVATSYDSDLKRLKGISLDNFTEEDLSRLENRYGDAVSYFLEEYVADYGEFNSIDLINIKTTAFQRKDWKWFKSFIEENIEKKVKREIDRESEEPPDSYYDQIEELCLDQIRFKKRKACVEKLEKARLLKKNSPDDLYIMTGQFKKLIRENFKKEMPLSKIGISCDPSMRKKDIKKEVSTFVENVELVYKSPVPIYECVILETYLLDYFSERRIENKEWVIVPVEEIIEEISKVLEELDDFEVDL